MKYYKLIDGQSFVGIATSYELRKIQAKYDSIIGCTEGEAQFVQYKDKYYHAEWMRKPDERIEYYPIQMIEIDKNEYDELYEMIERDEEIAPQPQPEPTPEPKPEPEDITVAYAKSLKIKEMSQTCENIIVNGVDVTLSDSETYHFSLTVQDQLNLTSLFELVKAGETSIAYHADGELCKFYSAEDITLIVTKAKELITFHTTYCNSLFAYINSLRSINTVSQVTYGMNIPEKYQSDVLKELLNS
jgi:hypothetical protein